MFIHVPALAAFAILMTAGVTVINVKFRLECKCYWNMQSEIG